MTKQKEASLPVIPETIQTPSAYPPAVESEDIQRKSEAYKTQRQLEELRLISEAELPLKLFGGYAEDAWLAGEVTREHNDLDFLAYRDDEEVLADFLIAHGYDHVEIEEAQEGRPLKHVFRRGPVALDLVLMDRRPDGSTYLDVRNYDDKMYRVELPDELLNYPTQQINGVEVQTTAPALQVMARKFFQETNRLPEREKDKVTQKALLESFPEVDVKPDYSRLN